MILPFPGRIRDNISTFQRTEVKKKKTEEADNYIISLYWKLHHNNLNSLPFAWLKPGSKRSGEYNVYGRTSHSSSMNILLCPICNTMTLCSEIPQLTSFQTKRYFLFQYTIQTNCSFEHCTVTICPYSSNLSQIALFSLNSTKHRQVSWWINSSQDVKSSSGSYYNFLHSGLL